MKISREAVALIAGVVLCIIIVTPFVMAIKYLEGGVVFILASPALVWLLLWLGRKLERWARHHNNSPPPDPDYPDASSPAVASP